MIRAVLFDLDGVLADSKPAWLATINAIRRDLRVTPLTMSELDGVWGQTTADDVEQFFPGLTVMELTARYEAEFPHHLDQVRPLDENAKAVVGELARTRSLAVTTNAPRQTARRMLQAVGVHEHFPTILTPEDVTQAKPAPDMILLACDRTGVNPTEAVLVGDTLVDILAATAAGVTPIGFRQAGAPTRIDHFKELPPLLDQL